MRGGGSSRASVIAKASAEDISGESTCISTESGGDTAIAEALQSVGVFLPTLRRSCRMSKLVEPTAEFPVCTGGVVGLGMGVGERSGGVVGT
jgi:hypothetical protein